MRTKEKTHINIWLATKYIAFCCLVLVFTVIVYSHGHEQALIYHCIWKISDLSEVIFRGNVTPSDDSTRYTMSEVNRGCCKSTVSPIKEVCVSDCMDRIPVHHTGHSCILAKAPLQKYVASRSTLVEHTRHIRRSLCDVIWEIWPRKAFFRHTN